MAQKRTFKVMTRDPWTDWSKAKISRVTAELVKEYLDRGGVIQYIPLGQKALGE